MGNTKISTHRVKVKIRVFSVLHFKSLEKYSMQRMKRDGDMGSPCLSPLLPAKKLVREPLRKIKKVGVETHYITQPI